MSAGPQEVDWDRLDKKKFFVVGVGLFSGVTTALYPLSVIKTRQMAAHKDVAAGLAGTQQIARQIWAKEGVRGFYRGFGTVVFGTIPARSVYLTTLEVTKATVSKLGERFDISAPALAGAASFVGGAAASASTQAVVVPIDVISQRLMMQGVPDTTTTTSSSSGAGGSAAASSSGASSSAAASSSGSSSRRSVAAVLEGMQQQQPLQQPVAGGSTAAGQASAVVSAQQAGTSPAAAAAAPTQPGSRSLHTSSRAAGQEAALRQHTPSVTQPHRHMQQPLRNSLHSSTQRPSSPLLQQPCKASFRQLSSAASVQHMNGFHMARLIVQQEGVRGLYRGFWPSLATFVPNSALWWGAYGFWQRLLWEQLPAGVAQPSSNSSSSSGHSTGTVVAVQTTASILSGCTTSVLTNPLDLVKTRLQVAEPVNGKVPSWSHLLRELLAEEGPRGLMRGLAPRMASSAMWGTAMVSVYEFLKRICAQPAA